MVLESLLAELLNRYIGDYVQNLDPKQLNVGIWGIIGNNSICIVLAINR